jgi:hypothetical protein
LLYSLDDLGPLVENPERQQRFERDSGLPWGRTVSELAGIHGVCNWRGFLDAVHFPGPVLGLDVPFRHRIEAKRPNVPAYYFEAELNRLGDYRLNHEWAVARLTAQFREAPRNADVSNCLQAEWEFGLFEVTLRAYIPEKTRRLGNNPLYKANPDLWQVCNLAVEARLCAIRDPDATLDTSDGFDQPQARLGPGDFETNRILAKRLPRSRVWRDDSGRLGIANRWASIVQPRAGATLKLEERTPARGGGSCALYLNEFSILEAHRYDGLRSVSERVAAFWKLPLTIESYPDE